MPNITFPTSSAPGRRLQEGGGRLVNAFVEKTLVGAPSDTIILRSPGIERMASDVTFTHTRGFVNMDSSVVWFLDNRGRSVDANFVVTDFGQLLGTAPITSGKNNAATKQYAAVTENGIFVWTTGPPVASTDPNLPANPTSVCGFKGYIVFSYGDGRIFATDLNDLSVNALSFNTEQGLFVRRVVGYGDRLYAFGDKWTGVYRDAGTIPFPFAREVTIPRGIISSFAVAGWETGWANELIWVGDDFLVYKLVGYTPTPISTNDVSRDIQAAVIAGGRASILAFVYMHERNAFWAVKCPGRFTWEYNLSTGEWNERASYARNEWKATQSVYIFDTWFVGDEYSGELYKVNGEYFREGTDPLIWRVDSGVISGFPRGMVIPRASFHITTGVGSFPLFSDPLIEISWSLDGGHTFGDPVLRRLGGPGETKSHPYILSSGLSKGQGVRYRLRVSDPVHVGLSGGVIEPEQRGFSG